MDHPGSYPTETDSWIYYPSKFRERFVWDQAPALYPDALVLRDRDTDANEEADERLYALQDSHFNVVALSDSEGLVAQRFNYSAFGSPSLFDNVFEPIPASPLEWTILFAAYFKDPWIGIYCVRNRYYHFQLGRWMQRDKILEQGGLNLFAAMNNDPIDDLDSSGLQASPPPPICCVKSLEVFYGGSANSGGDAYHDFTMVAEYEPQGTLKKIKGTEYCCEPARCNYFQEVKGYFRLNGKTLPFQSSGSGKPISPGKYVDDGYSNSDDADSTPERFETTDGPGYHAYIRPVPPGSIDIYMKVRSLIKDTNGTIVAQKEGYWIAISGRKHPYKMSSGGFS